MKILMLPVFLISICFSTALCQAKKPTIMIVPAKDWCVENNFYSQIDNQGVQQTIPNYEMALLKYPELGSAIGKIDAEMRKDGFSTVLLQGALDQLRQNAAEEAIMTSKAGAGVASSPIDKLRATARADIEFHVYWRIEKQGPRKRITQFRIQGIDTFTNNPVAFADGSGEWVSVSDVSDADLIREAVMSKMDGFKAELQTTFDRMFRDGRQVILYVYTWDSWEYDLESENFGDDELAVVIENWISENSVQGRFGTPNSSATRMEVKGIHIPMYDEKGRALTAPMWGRELVKFLKTKGIGEIKVDPLGVGGVKLFLGAK